MSRATAQYGDQLISGILSGQKFRQFQSDLKTSEIQRQLLEQQLGYNQTMQPLLVEHQRALAEGERTRTQTELLAQKLKEATFANSVAESGSRASEAKSNAAYAGTQADVAASTAGDVKSKAKADAARSKAMALQEQLQTIGNSASGGTVFTPTDINNLMDEMGVVNEPGTRNTTAKLIMGQVSQAQQRFEDNKSKIAMANEGVKALNQQRIAAALHDEITGGAQLSDLFAQADPETAQELQTKLANGEQLANSDYAKLAVSSYKRRQAASAAGTTTVTESPMDKTEQTDLGKLLVDLRTQLYAAKRSKKELEAGGAPASPTWLNSDSTDRENEIKQHEATIKELEDQIAEIRSQGKGVEKTTTKEGIVNSPLKYPPEIIAYAKANNLLLKSNPTKEEIAQAIEFVKSAKKGK